jgi:hypothetical protein
MFSYATIDQWGSRIVVAYRDDGQRETIATSHQGWLLLSTLAASFVSGREPWSFDTQCWRCSAQRTSEVAEVIEHWRTSGSGHTGIQAVDARRCGLAPVG